MYNDKEKFIGIWLYFSDCQILRVKQRIEIWNINLKSKLCFSKSVIHICKLSNEKDIVILINSFQRDIF